MRRGDWEVEGNRWAASSKSKVGRNVSWHKGIVPHPKSSQKGLTVRFVDRFDGGQTFSHLEGKERGGPRWEKKGKQD